VAHAPYTLNLCSAKPDVVDFARRAMAEDLARMELLPGQYYNFHPGSHVGQGSDAGVSMTAGLLNELLTPKQTTTVLLETMAGKGSEIGRSFEELAAIIDKAELKDKLGVCLDTCHMNDAGYAMENYDGVLDEFDRILSLKRLHVIHLNDSKNPRGARKDRHENIGMGTIGFETLCRIAHHPRTKDIPKILETPFIDGKAPYAAEIDMLRKKAFSKERLESLKDEQA
jgi:deoxyribonuclease-4